MNDRESLELAAKAAGHTITGWCAGRRGAAWAELSDTSKWNPIEDDGDALRLAVKLGIDVFPWQDKHRDRHDPYAATRRAIVRAAAEIGRQMQEGGAA